MTNLRDILRARLKDTVLRRVSGWKVLVVDDYTTPILASCFKMTDLTELEVSVLERVNLKRKPQVDFDAIYFLTPRKESVVAMTADFERGNRLYSKAHVFFTTALSDNLLKHITDSPALKHIMNVTEINTEFVVLEARAFLTSFAPKEDKGPSPFYRLFSPLSGDGLEAEIETIATQLASVCITLGELPTIRFDDKGIPARTTGTVARALAEAVQAKLQAAKEEDPESFNNNNDGSKCTLLILDRSVDLSTPFLHEFTYQAMVQDIRPLQDGTKYSYQTENMAGQKVEKAVVFDEEDELWARLRHTHIADTLIAVNEEAVKVASTDPAAKVRFQKAQNEGESSSGSGAKSLKQISQLARSMPEHAARVTKISAHTNLCQEVMKLFRDRKLEPQADVEQDMVTGETPEGDFPANIEGRIKALLTDPTITPDDKVRIVLLYRNYKGPLSAEDKAAIGLDKSGLNTADMQALANMDLLGANKDSLLDGYKANTHKKKKQVVEEDVPYSTSRYQPVLKRILDVRLGRGLLIGRSLPADEYPYLGAADTEEEGEAQKKGVSARTAKSKWASSSKPAAASAGSSRGGGANRIIVFIAGGMTYAEMRTVYEYENRAVFIGSTNVWRPDDFVRELRNLKKPFSADQ